MPVLALLCLYYFPLCYVVPIMRPLELKSCQSNQGVAAIWDTPPKSISVKRAQITQIFNYQVACRQENRVYDFDCAISLCRTSAKSKKVNLKVNSRICFTFYFSSLQRKVKSKLNSQAQKLVEKKF